MSDLELCKAPYGITGDFCQLIQKRNDQQIQVTEWSIEGVHNLSHYGYTCDFLTDRYKNEWSTYARNMEHQSGNDTAPLASMYSSSVRADGRLRRDGSLFFVVRRVCGGIARSNCGTRHISIRLGAIRHGLLDDRLQTFCLRFLTVDDRSRRVAAGFRARWGGSSKRVDTAGSRFHRSRSRRVSGRRGCVWSCNGYGLRNRKSSLSNQSIDR